jgi:hypothetical protein
LLGVLDRCYQFFVALVRQVVVDNEQGMDYSGNPECQRQYNAENGLDWFAAQKTAKGGRRIASK